jgi:hypothetical protein
MSFAAHPCHDDLLVEHNQEQSCQTMELERAIAAIIRVASHEADSSLKECALRPVPQVAAGQRRAISSAWKRYGTVGHIGS